MRVGSCAGAYQSPEPDGTRWASWSNRTPDAAHGWWSTVRLTGCHLTILLAHLNCLAFSASPRRRGKSFHHTHQCACRLSITNVIETVAASVLRVVATSPSKPSLRATRRPCAQGRSNPPNLTQALNQRQTPSHSCPYYHFMFVSNSITIS